MPHPKGIKYYIDLYSDRFLKKLLLMNHLPECIDILTGSICEVRRVIYGPAPGA